MAWERCSRDEIYIQTATGTPVIAEGYQDSDRTTGLGSQDGIVPDKVSDREAGTNRSGNTGRTRLLNMKGRWSFFLRYRKLLRNQISDKILENLSEIY